MTRNKTIILFIFCGLIIFGVLFFLQKKNTSQNLISGESSPTSTPLSSPSTSPSPLLNITSESKLSSESAKLIVPDFSDDYKKLDHTVSGF